MLLEGLPCIFERSNSWRSSHLANVGNIKHLFHYSEVKLMQVISWRNKLWQPIIQVVERPVNVPSYFAETVEAPHAYNVSYRLAGMVWCAGLEALHGTLLNCQSCWWNNKWFTADLFSTPAFNTPGRCELPAARPALFRGVQWRCLDVCPLIQVHCGCPKTGYFQFCWFNICCLLCAASLDKTLVADMTFWIAEL